MPLDRRIGPIAAKAGRADRRERRYNVARSVRLTCYAATSYVRFSLFPLADIMTRRFVGRIVGAFVCEGARMMWMQRISASRGVFVCGVLSLFFSAGCSNETPNKTADNRRTS